MSVRPILHYRILERLGAGAMGEVYLAEDLLLERKVVLKFLTAVHAAHGERLERLKQEARSLAALSHPHIAHVYALETGVPSPFLVMEYVDGENLRALLSLGPLPVDEVVRLGAELADALAHAHDRGVIHRDVKPDNVQVTPEGGVKLMDFGIAQWPGSRPGLSAYGSVDYTSPEQLRGDPVDGRGDVYALGVLLYEALTGVCPFRGADPTELARNILEKRPLTPSARRTGLPPGLDQILLRCLAKRAEDRFASARELAAALRALTAPPAVGAPEAPRAAPIRRLLPAVAIAAALVLGVGLLTYAPGEHRLAPAHGSARVWLPPFAMRDSASSGTFLGHAIADAIGSRLGRAGGIVVLPGAHPAAAGVAIEPWRARAAGADWMVSGELEQHDGRLKVSVRLVDPRSGRVSWQTVRQAGENDAPILASTLARELEHALGVVPRPTYGLFLNHVESRVLAASPLTSEALGAVRRSDLADEERTTRALVERFPREPEAMVLRCYALLDQSWEVGAAHPARQRFVRAVAQLDQLDPRTPWAAVFRGSILHRDGHVREADEAFSAVVARNDLSTGARAYVLSLRGQARRDLGRAEAAIADLEEALALDATNDQVLVILSDALGFAGRKEESLQRARQAVALRPDLPANQLALGLSLGRLDRWIEALGPIENASRNNRVYSYVAPYALALEHAGQPEIAREVASEAARLPESDWGDVFLARYRALAGDRDGALRLLERGFALGYADPETPRFPEFAGLRNDPGFRALISSMSRRWSEPLAAEVP